MIRSSLPTVLAGFLLGVGPGQAEPAEPISAACSPQAWTIDAAKAQLPECQRFVDTLPSDEPLRPIALGELAEIEARAGNWDRARELLDGAIALAPDNVELRLRRVRHFTGSRYAGEVLVDLQYLKAHHPDDARVWLAYGAHQMMFGAPEDAVRSFDKGIAITPRNADLRRRRAEALRALGRTAEALADLNFLIELDPGERRTYLARAELELENGRPERAIADIGIIRSLGPSIHDDTSFILAQAQVQTGKLPEALKSLDAALASTPVQHDAQKQRKALFLRLAILEALGDRQSARAALETLTQALAPNQLLRIQVLLRNLGWQEVAITGVADDATRSALAACVFLRSCNEPLQRT
jgi:tetratricopeptide (TPR) repeat protein